MVSGDAETTRWGHPTRAPAKSNSPCSSKGGKYSRPNPVPQGPFECRTKGGPTHKGTSAPGAGGGGGGAAAAWVRAFSRHGEFVGGRLARCEKVPARIALGQGRGTFKHRVWAGNPAPPFLDLRAGGRGGPQAQTGGGQSRGPDDPPPGPDFFPPRPPAVKPWGPAGPGAPGAAGRSCFFSGGDLNPGCLQVPKVRQTGTFFGASPGNYGCRDV